MMTPRHKRMTAAAALATAIAIPAEGLRQWAYLDPPGVLTVCFGHTGPDVQRGKKYTLDECRAFLTEDMREAVEIVERCAPGLPEHQLAAFADATFNIGGRLVCDSKTSTAARLLKAGDVEGACKQLPRWNRAKVGGVSVPLPGLTKRRAKEMELCLS